MAARKRVRKVLVWGTILLVSVVAGGLGFAFNYVMDSDTLAAMIRERAPRFFPGSSLEVDRVQLRPLLGQVTLNHVKLVQTLDRKRFPTAQVAWMSVRLDLKALLEGRHQPREVVLVQPEFQLRRRDDGSWNIQGLLADPWPAPPLESDPLLLIKSGTIQLVDGNGPDASVMLLRDVSLRAEPTSNRGTFHIEGSARGGPFDRVRLEGFANLRTGRIDLTGGELTRMNMNETFCRCLPEQARQRFHALGLTGGELDLTLKKYSYVPGATTRQPLSLTARLRNGTLVHRSLPDALNQVEASAALDGSILTIERAEGRNGKTAVAIRGRVSADDPAGGPFDLIVEITDLELDHRLRKQTPQYEMLWNEYEPEGWIDLAAHVVRGRAGETPRFGMTVSCRDVGAKFKRFPYAVQHVHGTLVWQGRTLRTDLQTLIGGEWVTASGTIENPGPEAVVKLDFASRGFPIDETLMRALPPDLHGVVNAFHPTGSVSGTAHLLREPPSAPGLPERVAISGEMDVNPGSSIRWDGMPYLVRDVTGHLEFTPDRWVFKGMKGSNGPASLTASGEVSGSVPGRQAVRLELSADNLPFDQQLRDALPPEWQATWATLNPNGRCRVEAVIRADPGQQPHYHLRVVPDPEETSIRLVLTPVGPEPGKFTTLQLPSMENVSGSFVFDDGTVTMSDVGFLFREAPVEVRGGTVVLRTTGEFQLDVQDLLVTKLRLDSELRKIMPPVMAEFARRLDDGRSFWLRGDLGIGWSGKPGEPARCQWDRTTVVFAGNTIQTGLPLQDIQGQFESVSGWSDGQSLALRGTLNLESVRLAGQQITGLVAPVALENGAARVDRFSARLLGGTVLGQASVSLDTTPRYSAILEIRGADLTQYTRTVPGRQNLRGLVSGRLEVSGQGHDIRAASGSGWARVQEGDLGQLPIPLRWAKVPNFRPPTRTAFDAVEVGFQIAGGEALLDPIKLTGDAFSLTGSGSVALLGERDLDLRLSPVYGRDERRLPIVGDVVREASGRVFDIRVTGPLDAPTIRPEPLPDVLTRTGQTMRRLSDRRGDRPTGN